MTVTVSEVEGPEKPPERDLYMTKEMVWIAQHAKEYPGEYVALDGDHLVAHHRDRSELRRLAREAGVEVPLIHYEPPGDEPLSGGFLMWPTP